MTITDAQKKLLTELDVAGMVCQNRVFLAPMAGYTNYPFRKMCMRLGAGLTFTEMVSAKGLHYGNAETELLLAHGDECPKAAQIFGSDPEIMREACESQALAPFDCIDINMGCPMPKVIKNGEGNALMENLPLAEKVIAACVKSGKRISVKFRTGVCEQKKITAEFARMCEGAGACMITVHGRTRDKIYSGGVDFQEIAAAKAAVGIPVVANGNVWSLSDAYKLLEKTGADAVMVARAALYDPRVFSKIADKNTPEMTELFLAELRETRELYGEKFATVFMRKMAAFYLKGQKGAAEKKRRLFTAENTQEVESLAREFFDELQ